MGGAFGFWGHIRVICALKIPGCITDSSTTKTADRGKPQGGVLLLTRWLLVVNELFLILPNTVVNDWVLSKGLKINKLKTETVLS